MTASSRQIRREIDQLQNDLGVPKRFVWKLKRDDDWSFIVKAHAFLDGALIQMLLKALGEGKLRRFIARLNFSRRVELAEVLGLLDRDQLAFVRLLGDIRNKIVHDVSQIGFSLKRHFASLSPAQRSSIFIHPGSRKKVQAHLLEQLDRLLPEVPRDLIYLQVVRISHRCFEVGNWAETRAQSRDEVLQFALRLAKHLHVARE